MRASVYVGPRRFGERHWADAAAFRDDQVAYAPPPPIEPRPRSVVPAGGAPPLIDLLICHHEAAHVVHHYIHGKRIHDVAVKRGGDGGEFRSVPNPIALAREDTPQGGADQIAMMLALCDRETRRVWLNNLVGYAVALQAQRKFGSRHHDAYCDEDYRVINRVLDAITSDPERKAKYLQQVERDAKDFVDLYWPQISALAQALFERGRLDEHEIAQVLRAFPLITLNEAGAEHARALVRSGLVNDGPWAFDSSDGDKLLGDNVDWDNYSKYHLGEDTSADGLARYYYPFGKGNEIYTVALKAIRARAKEHGAAAVDDYARNLLDDIAKEKKAGRYYGDRDDGIFWRHDGYLKPFR